MIIFKKFDEPILQRGKFKVKKEAKNKGGRNSVTDASGKRHSKSALRKSFRSHVGTETEKLHITTEVHSRGKLFWEGREENQNEMKFLNPQPEVLFSNNIRNIRRLMHSITAVKY